MCLKNTFWVSRVPLLRTPLLSLVVVLAWSEIGWAQVGACCKPDNTCADSFSQQSCRELFDGHWQGAGTACVDGCPDCDCDGLSDAAEIGDCVAGCLAGGGNEQGCKNACDPDHDDIPNGCEDGAQDPDGDGVHGACDGCPDDAAKAAPGICGCGTPDTDTDSDGPPDCVDFCPFDPDNDADQDGLCGDVDNCPLQFNPDQTDNNGNGVGDICEPCNSAADCDDMLLCTDDTCVDSTCVYAPIDCPPDEFCDPADGTCKECISDADCDDGSLCTIDSCVPDLGLCKFIPVQCPIGLACNPDSGKCGDCLADADCDDELFCTGVETCGPDHECNPGTSPCTDPALPICDEDADECVECLMDIDCDDGTLCTVDHCIERSCSFEPVICPEGQGCDPTDGTCRFCQFPTPGQCCNPADGSLAPLDDGNSCTDDVCNPDGTADHTVNSLAPDATGLSPRRISVTPQPFDSDHPVALLVTSPNFECLAKYVDIDGALVDTPVFLTPAQWGTVVIADQDIIPSATKNPTVYNVQADCGGGDLTEAGQAIPAVWGDVNMDGDVTINDIFCVLDGFLEIYEFCTLEQVDLAPCTPDGRVNIFDILLVLDAFAGQEYPCAAPCGGGACCATDSTHCEIVQSAAQCDLLGGIYQGGGTSCAFNPCLPPDTP